MQDSSIGYSNADTVIKLQGRSADNAKSVAQASLSALKQLILSDKELPGTHPSYHHIHPFSLYIPLSPSMKIRIFPLCLHLRTGSNMLATKVAL